MCGPFRNLQTARKDARPGLLSGCAVMARN
jgi:hypothetical protein